MDTEPVFCWSGCGYLQDFVSEKGKVTAKIKVLTHYDAHKTDLDAVWMECAVEDTRLRFRFIPLVDAAKKGKEVILNFKAGYQGFLNACSGQKPDDPSSIITVRGKLLALNNCYIDGQIASGLSVNTLNTFSFF